MENNTPEFNMDKYNDFLKQIHAGSPVHKINFVLESPNAIAGMHLISMDDTKSYLDKVADYENLNEDTLLVFESRHVIECCQIIYGCLNILKGIGMLKVSYNFVIDHIIETLLTKPSFRKDLITRLDNIVFLCVSNKYSSDYAAKIIEAFRYIMQNIWFVPYGKIDEIAEEAINEFKKQNKPTEDE